MVVKGDTLTVIRVIPDSETTDLYMEERRVDTGTWSRASTLTRARAWLVMWSESVLGS